MKYSLLTLLISCTLFASKTPPVTMKSNSQLVYNVEPKSSDSLMNMFSDGKFYGRLRSNTFYFWWEGTDTVNNDIHLLSGLGGSVVYKSASYGGFDFAAGLYYSRAFFENKEDHLSGWKAGKDTVSRFDLVNTGDKSMAVLGQAYVRYRPTNKSEIIAGRQIVEGFYTKSNDTKMIPNTFDGLVVNSSDIVDTEVQLAVLAKQKLRDHTQSHSVLVYGDSNATLSTAQKPEWSQNDDSAMHRGLTYTALKRAGISTDAPLITGGISNGSIEHLRGDFAFYMVPELLSQAMGELNYEFAFDGFSLIPGVRYIKQFDNGAGAVGGASLRGDVNAENSAGYQNPDSLESQMIAARLVAIFNTYKLNVAYTNVFDEADLVTPWRGFPTAGYTRSMARYNWRANTQSYRIELVRNTSDIGLYHDLFVQTSIMYQDNDAAKNKGIDFDSLYYYVGFMQNVAFLDNAQWRYRLGYQDFLDEDVRNINNIDTRLELNYFF